MLTRNTTDQAINPDHDGCNELQPLELGTGEYITLAKAAQLAPGRPSSNCVWRWCRRGVLARSGERVHLRHVRVGGKIFTKSAWVDDFGERLARADAEYFGDPETSMPEGASPDQDGAKNARSRDRASRLAQVERELAEEGL